MRPNYDNVRTMQRLYGWSWRKARQYDQLEQMERALLDMMDEGRLTPELEAMLFRVQRRLAAMLNENPRAAARGGPMRQMPGDSIGEDNPNTQITGTCS